MRLLGAAWWLQLRLLNRSPFFLGMAVTTPIAYVTLALLMSDADDVAAARIVVGAGLMGAWSAALFGAGEALYMQRWTGTLELLAGAPRSLSAPVLEFSAATATLGVYSIAAALGWAVLVFGVSVPPATFVGLVVCLLLALVGLCAMGTVLAAFYVLTRQALTVSNLLEFPIWIVSGLLVSTSVLWPPLVVVGRAFPIGWAMAGVDAVLAGRAYVTELGVGLAATAGYVALGLVLLRVVERRARHDGTLVLR